MLMQSLTPEYRTTQEGEEKGEGKKRKHYE
jgi:hypothetical protein